MKTSKIADKMNEHYDGHALENLDLMIDFMKILQDGSMVLTKLILEHCKNENFKKEDIFKIFAEETITVAESMKNSNSKIASGGCGVCED
ncbi:MAG: hypothetical protein ACR2HS_00295 [Gammaproteobacteria bacterium]